jgi:hypothetical protein
MRRQAGIGERRGPRHEARPRLIATSAGKEPAPRMAGLKPPVPSIATWPTKRSGPRPMFSGNTPGLRRSDGGSASAGCWLGASSLAGRLGAVRSGAARVRARCGLRFLEQLIDAILLVAWSGSAACHVG